MVLQSHGMTDMTSMTKRLVRIPPLRDEGTTSNGCYQDKAQNDSVEQKRPLLVRDKAGGAQGLAKYHPEKTPVTAPKPTQQGSDGWGLKGLLDLSATLATHYTLLFLPTDMDWLLYTCGLSDVM
ncbi:hypothetical protein FOZG_05513 [Fusarium oxysporum Fo47]|uniref:Uncharacterized protein n=1 Tax=Fusarium oxysporum Fo47 TaxID=660027 RepID=W9KSI7_FUSOX|nr:hypothetical protein FOZG_05513 [Fusarium oxysporum Fo47]